jgi:hypothetical protein
MENYVITFSQVMLSHEPQVIRLSIFKSISCYVKKICTHNYGTCSLPTKINNFRKSQEHIIS